MSIYETIQRDKLVPGANRATLSLIMSEITVDGKPMSDSDAITRLSQMKKTCEKNIVIYQTNRNESMEFEEIDFIEAIIAYLPAGATEKDIEMAIIAVGAEKSMKSMGKVMGYLKKSFAVVDGNLVKNILLEK